LLYVRTAEKKKNSGSQLANSKKGKKKSRRLVSGRTAKKTTAREFHEKRAKEKGGECGPGRASTEPARSSRPKKEKT